MRRAGGICALAACSRCRRPRPPRRPARRPGLDHRRRRRHDRRLPLARLHRGRGPATDGFACTGTVIAPRVVLTAGALRRGHRDRRLHPGARLPRRHRRSPTSHRSRRRTSSGSTQHPRFPGFDPGATRGDAGILDPRPPDHGAADRAGDRRRRAPSTPGGAAVADRRLGPDHASDAAAPDEPARRPRPRSRRATTAAARRKPLLPLLLGSPAALHDRHARRSHRRLLRRQRRPGDRPPRRRHRGRDRRSSAPAAPAAAPSCPNIFTRVDLVSAWAAEWVAAIEAGAPAPRSRRPRRKLPTLTIPKAKTLVGRRSPTPSATASPTASALGSAANAPAGCAVRCGLAWFFGANDYYGTVSVRYALLRSSVVWKGSYAIHWVNDHCWFESGHRAELHGPQPTPRLLGSLAAVTTGFEELASVDGDDRRRPPRRRCR